MIASTSFGAFQAGTTTGTTATASTQATRSARDVVAPVAATGRVPATSQQALPTPGQIRPRGSLLDISA